MLCIEMRSIWIHDHDLFKLHVHDLHETFFSSAHSDPYYSKEGSLFIFLFVAKTCAHSCELSFSIARSFVKIKIYFFLILQGCCWPTCWLYLDYFFTLFSVGGSHTFWVAPIWSYAWYASVWPTAFLSCNLSCHHLLSARSQSSPPELPDYQVWGLDFSGRRCVWLYIFTSSSPVIWFNSHSVHPTVSDQVFQYCSKSSKPGVTSFSHALQQNMY